MNDTPTQGINLGMASSFYEGSLGSRDSYWSLALSYRNDRPVEKVPLGMYILGTATPDLRQKSGAVDIRQDYYSIHACLRASAVYLFRYSVFAGPGYVLSASRMDVLGNKRTIFSHSLSYTGGFAVDYAVDDRFEVSYSLRAQYRVLFKHTDWEHGVTLGYNF